MQWLSDFNKCFTNICHFRNFGLWCTCVCMCASMEWEIAQRQKIWLIFVLNKYCYGLSFDSNNSLIRTYRERRIDPKKHNRVTNFFSHLSFGGKQSIGSCFMNENRWDSIGSLMGLTSASHSSFTWHTHTKPFMRDGLSKWL